MIKNKDIIFNKSSIGQIGTPTDFVYVRSIADFPEPDENNKIQLEDKHYIIMNAIEIFSTFFIGQNTKITSLNYGGALITRSDGDFDVPLFEITDNPYDHISFTLDGVAIASRENNLAWSPSKIFDLTGFYNTSRIMLQNCIFSGGVINKLSGNNVDVDNCIFNKMFGGINSVTIGQSYSITNNVFRDWENEPDVVMITIGSNYSKVHISDNIFEPQSNETIFDFTAITSIQSVLLASNQFDTIADNTGDIFVAGSKDQKDPEIIAIGNTNLRDSTVLGQFAYSYGVETTALIRNIPTRINARYDTGKEAERTTIVREGLMTYTGNAPQRLKVFGFLKIACLVENNFRIDIYINGVDAGVETAFRGTTENVSIGGVVNVETGDTIEIMITNTTGDDNITSSEASVILSK